MSKAASQEWGLMVEIGEGDVEEPALEMQMSMRPNSRLAVAKAASTLCLAVTSIASVRTLTPSKSFRRLSAASFSTSILRPVSAISRTPAVAKPRAIARPIPVPPPVMRRDFPFAESEGRLGEIDG